MDEDNIKAPNVSFRIPGKSPINGEVVKKGLMAIEPGIPVVIAYEWMCT